MDFLGECNGYQISYTANATTRTIHYCVKSNGRCVATASTTPTICGWSFEYGRNELSSADATAIKAFIERHRPDRLL